MMFRWWQEIPLQLRGPWGSGLLLPDNDPIIAAEMVNRVLADEAFKENFKNQRIRLQDFDNQKVKTQFLQIIDKIIQGK